MDKEEKQILLELARNSIKSYFDKEKPATSKARHMNKKQGCFVTLHKDGELRGCIGFPHPTHPLYHAIVEAARSAAFGDPRFPPLLREELDKIKVEVSVLTEPKLLEVRNPSEYIQKIRIGTDGLIIKGEYHSGLLLPEVAQEQAWTQSQFLNALCQKAGLPFDAWKHPDVKIYTFQAEVFSE